MPKSEKVDNSVKYVQIWPKMNRVIYTLDLICEADIMILAQAVLQKVCSQGCFTIQNAKVGKGR